MVTRPYVYEPSKSFRKRITRRLTPFQARRMAQYKLDRPIVSFTFDDCPLSAIDNGVSKLDELGWKSTIYIASALLGTTNHHGLQIPCSRENRSMICYAKSRTFPAPIAG